MDHQWLTMRASYMDFNVSFHLVSLIKNSKKLHELYKSFQL